MPPPTLNRKNPENIPSLSDIEEDQGIGNENCLSLKLIEQHHEVNGGISMQPPAIDETNPEKIRLINGREEDKDLSDATNRN